VRETLAYTIHGPQAGRTRIAEIRPVGFDQPGYHVWVDGQLRYSGIVFTLAEAKERVMAWTAYNRIQVVETSHIKYELPKVRTTRRYYDFI